MSPSDVFSPFWHRFSNRPTRSVEELRRLLTPQSFSIPDETRFSGHWVIAPPGRGKTTLLHTLIADDLEKDAAVVLMDSKGDLIEPIKNLASIKDRLLLIEPNPDAAFALNPLDVSHSNVTQAVGLIEYIMAGLLDAKFTALQSTLFRNVVPAIIEAIPNPPPMRMRSNNTIGNKAGAGIDAAIWAMGCAIAASFGLRPIETPTGIVQSAASTKVSSMRRKVAPAPQKMLRRSDRVSKVSIAPIFPIA